MISFKFYYYYTYLVIGLALLGLGAGGVAVAVSGRLRRAATDTIVMWCLLLGAAAVGLGYLIVASTSINTFVIWHYETASMRTVGLLLVICVAMSASFFPAGVLLSTLFGRKPEAIGRLYFVDLVGAGLACAIVVSLIGWIGPPATIFLAGTALALAGLRVTLRHRSRLMPLAVVLAVLLAVAVVVPRVLPNPATDLGKINLATSKVMYSSWSPIFRVDVVQFGNVRLFFHDGIPGAEMLQWDGHISSLGQFGFDKDSRALPFVAHGSPPAKVVIIGAAAGHEVLTSLHFKAGHIDAIELNPVTYRLTTQTFADFDGHLAQNPKVHYVFGDGRTFMARSDNKYDLVWLPAPDSYSAANASTASAFVLSESYLYTSNAVVDSLKHLAPDGILAAQFGEIDFEHKPNRTTRYVATVRQALAQLGISDPTSHILVSTAPPLGALAGLSTVLVKRTPFTPDEVGRFASGLAAVPGSKLRYAPYAASLLQFGVRFAPNPVSEVVSDSRAQLSRFNSSYRYAVGPISDDRPFMWHFAPFGTVIRDFAHPIKGFVDLEDSVGERVLVLLLAVATILAAAFLLLPFVAIRDVWVRLPWKGSTAVYFLALGLGFIFFEITLIQRLILFLGYPTYSLTVTLSSTLIFVGMGALLSGRWQRHLHRAPAALLAAVAALTVYYLFGLTPTTGALLHLPMAARVAVAFVLLAPLGLCLGMFMPLGLAAVAKLSDHPREYVAWGWAVNGFASVIGSVLATVLAMTFGFRLVLVLALIAYLIASIALRGLLRMTAASPG